MKGDTYDFIEAYLNYKNKHWKIFEKEYQSVFIDYRDKNVNGKQKTINMKSSKLRIHQLKKTNR